MDAATEIAELGTPHHNFPLTTRFSPERVKNVAISINDAMTLEQIKVLAYALYLNAVDLPELQRRLRKPSSVIQTTIDFLATLPAIDEPRAIEALSGRMAGYGGRVIASIQAEGWALALFDLIYECRLANWLDLFRAPDPAIVGIRWALQGNLQPVDDLALIDLWCDIANPIHIAAAGLIVERSAKYAIEGVGSMYSIAQLPAMPRAMIAGRLTGMLIRKEASHNAERSARRELLLQDLIRDLPSYIQTPKELAGFMHGREHEPDLVAFALKLPLNNKSVQQAKRNAHSLLENMFSRINDREKQQEERMLHYVAATMLNDLAHAAVEIDMQPQYFSELLGNLRFDEFTYYFENDLYYEDRARAIVLCAIGSIVAKKNPDVLEIGVSAREAADIMWTLPVGVNRVLNDHVQAQLERDYGIKLPLA